MMNGSLLGHTAFGHSGVRKGSRSRRAGYLLSAAAAVEPAPPGARAERRWAHLLPRGSVRLAVPHTKTSRPSQSTNRCGVPRWAGGSSYG